MLCFAARRWLVTTLTHTLVIYEPYTTGPLPPRQTLSNAHEHNNVIPPLVIAHICVESTCISVMRQAFISHHLSQPATCCTEIRGGEKLIKIKITFH